MGIFGNMGRAFAAPFGGGQQNARPQMQQQRPLINRLPEGQRGGPMGPSGGMLQGRFPQMMPRQQFGRFGQRPPMQGGYDGSGISPGGNRGPLPYGQRQYAPDDYSMDAVRSRGGNTGVFGGPAYDQMMNQMRTFKGLGPSQGFRGINMMPDNPQPGMSYLH